MANKECLKPWICYHPGEMLQEKLQEENMSVGDFVTRSQVPADIVRDIINGDASISSDIAIAFEQVTHIPAHLWINLQHSYDDYILKQQRPSYLSRILRLANRAAVM
ncbi:MAG: HigA family addiction module antitoxin [Bacteroidales bacterium]|nr:HigA family addiction module antitoxin [Bacteroidales bacterium]